MLELAKFIIFILFFEIYCGFNKKCFHVLEFLFQNLFFDLTNKDIIKRLTGKGFVLLRRANRSKIRTLVTHFMDKLFVIHRLTKLHFSTTVSFPLYNKYALKLTQF